ncbi:MAG: TRAP transporter small permease subunit [Alphaproteobacteria bacterium]|nr:TRAP transporter small permease subunit [Alphaproteobacteria bacterium]
MQGLAAFVRLVDRFNDLVGRTIAWLIFGSVLICASTAIMRYALNIGFVWMQELYIVLFGLNFTLAAGWAYYKNQHVRVDLLHIRMNERRRAWVELIGFFVLLLPWLAVIIYAAVPFVGLSWRILESSSQASGMPGVFLYKTAIPIFCFVLGVQGLAAVSRSVLVLANRQDLLPPRGDAA